ncbi:MAG: Zn-ribbon domain-containing OB-fold protein [Moorella sp. (in: Bacteria)]|nr:Zn-ribbon domain-containing OB-fold protein [Moorella sp. (in: firmicutes)]
MKYPLTYKQFYEGLKQGKVLGLKCRSCGAYTAPPKMCCAECTGSNLEVVELSGRGEIKTFTVIRVPPEGFTAPYIVAMAELEEGPWLLGNLEGVDADQASLDLIGKKVKVGHKVIPPMRYSAGEGVAVTFSLA